MTALKKKLKNRLKKSSAGFSLSEALVSVLIMTLVSVLLVSGMSTIMKTYRRSVNAANAQTLISTAVTELRNELSLASNVSVDSDNNVITYRNSNGQLCSIKNGSFSDTSSNTGVKTYPGLCITVGGTSRELVSAEASTVLFCQISNISADSSKSTVTIGNIKVVEPGSENLSSLSSIENLVMSVQTVE